MYVLPNVRPVGTHHSSNAQGWPGGMLVAGIDLHITPGCLFSGGGLIPGSSFLFQKLVSKCPRAYTQWDLLIIRILWYIK